MTLRASSRVGTTTLPTRGGRRPERRLAEHRRAYDARRRQELDPQVLSEVRDYGAVLRRDPCSYCMGFCGQMAADHIESLEHGGQQHWSNLTAAGRPCNASKKDKRLLVWLLSRPQPPAD